MADAELRARIETLEMYAAHQEQTLQDLSEALADQWGLVERLQAEVARLRDGLEKIETQLENPATDDQPPPHY